VLTGELVTLRPVEPDDYPRFAAFRNNVEVQVLADGRAPVPLPVAVVTQRWEQVDGTASFAMVENAGGTLIGHCNLHGEHQLNRTAELGIVIGDRGYWGRGYGREAVSLLVDYGFRYRNLRRIYLETKATNERAIRSYRAAGFVEEARRREHIWSDGRYIDIVVMGLLRN
jgi:RimJ/RimL family protein N-acetyltransferase